MLRHAIDNGLNYIDTAWPYHGGNNEKWLGKALADGYREKVKIATKLPTWAIEKTEDFDRYLNEQLERLKVKSIDFYLLHNIQEQLWPAVRRLGVRDWMLRIRDQGKVKHLGFSFHGGYPLLQQVLDDFDAWEFCQFQYNYVNEDVQAGTKGVELAASKGLGVVVMEPLLGGCLANPPDVVKDVLGKTDPLRLAFDWLWNKPEISLVLSGMGTMDQVEQNIAFASNSAIGKLSADDQDLIARACEAYGTLETIPCTKCRYCMPCPDGVDIPANFEHFNSTVTFGGTHQQLNKALYNGLEESRRASSCTACRQCEEKCPQNIMISDWMPKVHAELKR
jgi:uncharacterized protein